jgi:hypothetical protein
MFENYSIADLYANIYKKKVINFIVLVLIFCVMAIPYTYKVINNKTIVKDTTNYYTYITYKITSPLEEQQSFDKNKIGGYSDFYGKLVTANINGAYLFNDLSEKDMKVLERELDTSANTLKNSNYDYWEKKITVSPLVNNAGVTVKILTPSKMANDIIEKKLDGVVNKFKDTYANVKIEKLETINSVELVAKDGQESGISKVSLLIRLAVLGVAAFIITVLGNIVLYIFNPTINRAGDYSKYEINLVTKLSSASNLKELIEYKAGNSAVVLLSSDKKIIEKFLKQYSELLTNDNITVGNINEITTIIKADNVLFVEEYGVTRYKNFEEVLQIVQNVGKKVLGVATFKL